MIIVSYSKGELLLQHGYKPIEKPIKRSKLRGDLGMFCYGLQRKLIWIRKRKLFAKTISHELLPYAYFTHRTPLYRKLKDVDMWYQHNKVINIKIAMKQMNGIIIHSGEIFSYWNLIKNPTKRKGYVDGMILKNGTFTGGIGGGLCQLSNLIFWITAHTPLTIIERHRHGYDVFPDSNRTQPFGSGATCFYPHGDLMIQNNTPHDYQLAVKIDGDFLVGQWRLCVPPQVEYKIIEKNHEMRGEYWGGYSRHNQLYQQQFSLDGTFLCEDFLLSNSAIMMYSPFLGTKSETTTK